ncbi:MAG: hypothetical protein ABGZ23_05075 [Fuerstiella sp.]|nr:hypothetical protein [Fuerstiella sp.]
MTQVTRRARPIDRSAQLFVVGNVLLAVLLSGGIAHSVISDGRPPKIRVGFADTHRHLIDTRKHAEIIPDLQTAASINFDDGVTQLQLLSTAYKAHDTDSIVLGLRGLLNHAPDDSELHGELATVLLGIGHAEDALRHAEDALRHFEDALVHSSVAVRLNPDSSRLQITQGAVMLALERNQEAAASYRKALELNPDSEPAQRALKYPLKNY